MCGSHFEPSRGHRHSPPPLSLIPCTNSFMLLFMAPLTTWLQAFKTTKKITPKSNYPNPALQFTCITALMRKFTQ